MNRCTILCGLSIFIFSFLPGLHAQSSVLRIGSRAKKQAESKQYGAALASYRKLERIEPNLKEHARLMRAQIYFEKGDYTAAMQTVRMLDATYLPPQTVTQVHAQSLIALEEYQTAIDLLSHTKDKTTELEYLTAKAQLLDGHINKRNASNLNLLWPQRPTSSLVLDNLALLINHKNTFSPGYYNRSDILQAKKWLSHKKVKISSADLKQLVKKLPIKSHLKSEALLALATLYAKKNQWQHAHELYKTIIQRTSVNSIKGRAFLGYGIAARHLGKPSTASFKQAIAIGDTTTQQKAWLELGTVYIGIRSYPQAKKAFQSILLMGPLSKSRPQALFSMGFINWREANFNDAQRFFTSTLQESIDPSLKLAAMYWLGRTLEEKNQFQPAAQTYYDLLYHSPIGYYPYLATMRLNKLKNRTTVVVHGTNQDDSNSDYWNQWYTTILQLRNSGHTKLAQKTALLSQEVPFGSLPQTLQQKRMQVRYPLKYEKDIRKQAKKNRVPPALMFGLVLQESRFNPQATSRVGAIGLTQLMPKTARELLKSSSKRRTPIKKVYDPKLNLALGAQYLGRMLRGFRWNIIEAVASYNAGPGAVTRWRATRGPVPEDIFVEEIPFAETRKYVRRVLGAALAYNYLYGDSVSPPGQMLFKQMGGQPLSYYKSSQ